METTISDPLPVPWVNEEDRLQFKVPKETSTDISVYQLTVDLFTLANFTSDITDCGASEISLCANDDCSTLAVMATDKAQLQTNPSLKAATGLITSNLLIDKRTPFEFNFTLEAKNSGPSVVSTSIPLEVIVCGDETLVLAEAAAQTFLITRNTDSFELFTDVDLLGLFTLGVRERCLIEKIEFLHQANSTAFAATDEIYVLLGLGDRATDLDAINFDTTFT